MTSPRQTMAPVFQGISRRLERLWPLLLLGSILLRKRRLTPRKLWTAARNSLAFLRRAPVSGAAPTVALIDVTSFCNLYCVTCRNSRTELIDMLGQTERKTVLGSMSLEMFTGIIDDFADDMVLAALYTSGEPLLNRQIVPMVAHADRRGMATMMASNGVLATPDVAEELLRAGLDYFKVAISGMTQDVYEVYHRGGDIAAVLANMAAFSAIRRRLGIPCLLVVDYILFEHNRHQLAEAQRFCREHGLIFTLRYGRVLEGSPIERPAESADHYLPKSDACDWLWKILSVCTDGRVVPCCRFATCAESPFVFGHCGEDSPRAIWNGDKIRQFRTIHTRQGRTKLPMCNDCFYSGINFQS